MPGKAGALIKDYKQGKMSLLHEVSDFMSDWLNKHIIGTDKQYSRFMNGVRVNYDKVS
jgi:hemerythrin